MDTSTPPNALDAVPLQCCLPSCTSGMAHACVYSSCSMCASCCLLMAHCTFMLSTAPTFLHLLVLPMPLALQLLSLLCLLLYGSQALCMQALQLWVI